MSNYFMDHYNLNGDTVLIQDRGRAQPNGIATIDADSKLPLDQMPDWANNMYVSPNDPYNMTIKEWIDTLGSPEFKHREIWTQGTGDNTAYTMQYLVRANGLWVCGSNGHGMWWSEDGKTWTQGTGSNTTYTMQYLVYANGLWVCGSVSRGMWWSEDGKTWTQGTGSNTTYEMTWLIYQNNLWLCGTTNHGIWWSEDGKTWTQGNSDTGKTYFIVFENAIWLWGAGSKTYWSENGKTWTQCTGLASYHAEMPVYANGLWVMGLYSKGAYWSTDGKSWTQCTGLSNISPRYAPIYEHNLWLYGTSNNGVWWSEDGKAWTQCSVLTTNTVDISGYVNGLFYIATNTGGLWWSENGKDWTKCTGTDNFYVNPHSGIAYIPKMLFVEDYIWFIIGAKTISGASVSANGVWYSKDGKAWEQNTNVDPSYEMQYFAETDDMIVCGSLSHGLWWTTKCAVYIPETA